VHLAGITFPDAGLALEERLLGVEPSTHPRESQPISPHLTPLRKARV
jgi:hypothetical protein